MIVELEQELAWITRVLDRRFRAYFPQPQADGTLAMEPVPNGLEDLPPPTLGDSPWGRLVAESGGGLVERLALSLCLVPHVRPQLLDVFFTKNSTFDRRFTEFGGLRGDDHFEPSGDTVAFVLDGGSIAGRRLVSRILSPDHPLQRLDILRPAPVARDQSPLKAPLRLSPEALSLVLTGQLPTPQSGPEFPAQRLESRMNWEDLVLHPGTMRQLGELRSYLEHGHTLMEDWGMSGRLRPGVRALFYGPPGTGKTLSAALIGKAVQREVYRIDLSLVVSKYIGETEKNLARVFDKAERRNWILFFDEADALFGKRTETKDAHDRYANQEVSYLLQRVESFGGVVILASNLKDNVDPAFMRRFEVVVYFPMPRAEERLRLWREGFSPKAKVEVDLSAIAREHELSGGAILNVIRAVSLTSIAEGQRPITREDLAAAIRREQAKEGRPS
ncbi:MAG TPA: ATP-binding protein [Myxococcota bacterium]|nr:ATP-binding protein [Myxococcota bacterium]